MQSTPNLIGLNKEDSVIHYDLDKLRERKINNKHEHVNI